jgi:aryl-alcohol dehydrogenase-like predicted oxidoreductase
MEQRTLGSTDVSVSTVGFGAWVVGTDWWGDRTPDEAIDLVEHALEAGITFFDTADVYGHGRSEELLGEALAAHRDAVTIGTKVGYDFYNNPQAGHGELPKRLEPDWVETALDRSLDRLGMEYVDLLQLHNANCDEVTPELLETIDRLRESGRVEAIGWALGPSIGWLAEADEAATLDVDAVQTVFNVLEQAPGRYLIDRITEHGADTSVLARVPHSSGLLNEQVTPDTDLGEGDHRSHRPQAWFEAGWEKVDRLRFLERDGERTMGQAAIQWLLAQDHVASVTPTFRDADDVAEWAAAPDTPPLTEAELERVADLYADDFAVARDDGMSAEDYRTSVGGDDLQAAGLVAD